MARVDPQTFAQLRDLERQFNEQFPKALRTGVAKELYRQGQAFKRQYRPRLESSFKSGARRILKGFRVYTAGDTLDELELGIFTRWPAAGLYEDGGTITPRRRQWLVVPLSPRVLTPTGRVRREYRNAQNGGFSPKFWDGVNFIKTRRGLLAVRPVTGTSSTRVGFRARQYASNQSRITTRLRPALEIVAILIKKTTRDPVLEFFDSFDRFGLQIDAGADELAAAFAQQVPGPSGSR